MNWRVSWNKNFYDYKKLIRNYKENNTNNIINQSKGRAKMVKLPQINDYVYVSCDKKKIMKCIIISNFIIGDEENQDPYNIGNPRLHATNNTYLKMQILEVYDDPKPTFKGCQRTWSKYKDT